MEEELKKAAALSEDVSDWYEAAHVREMSIWALGEIERLREYEFMYKGLE